MKRISLALSLALLLAGGVQAQADAPQIAYVTEGSLAVDSPFPGHYGIERLLVPQGEITLATGEGFLPSRTMVRWVSQESFLSDEAFAKVLERRKEGLKELPLVPFENARTTAIIKSSARTIAFRAPEGGSYALWMGDATNGWSKPWIVNKPVIHWLSSDRIAPGSIVYAFGRNLRPLVYVKTTVPKAVLRNRKTNDWRILKESTAPDGAKERENRHMAWFYVPPDIPEGEYDFLLHNDTGGDYGWADAIALRIARDEPWPQKVYNVAQYGAVASGYADSRSAIQSAIDAAGKAGGGIVYLPAGTYYLGDGLVMAEKVVLRGAGRNNTTLKVLEETFPSSKGKVPGLSVTTWNEGLVTTIPVILGGHRFTVEDLAIEAGPFQREQPYLIGPAVAVYAGKRVPVEDVTIRRCRIEHRVEVAQTPWWGRDAMASGAGIVAFQGSLRLKVMDNEFRSRVAVATQYAERARVSNNRIEDFPGQVNHPFHMIGISNSEITENIMAHCATGMHLAATQNDASVEHNYIAWNTFELSRTAVGADDGETMLVHPMDNYDQVLMASGSGSDTVTLKGAQWVPDSIHGRWLMIIDGKGLGQYRKVVGNSADTLKVDKPWKVLPGEGSQVLIKVMSVENTFFRNSFRSAEGSTGMWLDIANIIDQNTFLNTLGLSIGSSRGYKTRGTTEIPMFCGSYFNDCSMNKVFQGGGIFVVSSIPTMADSSMGMGGLNLSPRPAATENVMFGNFIRRNQVVQPSFASLWQLFPSWNWDANPTWMSGNYDSAAIQFGTGPIDSPANKAALIHWTVIEGNHIAQARKGIGVHYRCADTIVSNNKCQAVDTLLCDEGKDTLVTQY